MVGKWRHDVMAKGNRARLCRTSWGGSCCGAGRTLYQLGNVWGRLGGNFITLCWAVPLMCYQTSARDLAVSLGERGLEPHQAATTEQREGAGKRGRDNFPPKKTAGGLCPPWTSHRDLGETLLSPLCDGDGGMKGCFHIPGYLRLVVKDCGSC